MKKLKLKALDFSAAEILTREQLKTVMGGSGGDDGGSGDGGSGSAPKCKTDPCTYYDMLAKVNRSGTCGSVVPSGPKLPYCACKVKNVGDFEDSACNQ